jgi:hypothetical protein
VDIDPRALISPHFFWGELTRTDSRDPAILAAQEHPPGIIQQNLSTLARELLEPVHQLVGRIRINSGYRSPALNASLPGASTTSRHMDGLAADCFPLDLDLVEAYERIAGAGLAELDQLILEFGRWIHVGAAPVGAKPRGQLLMIFTPGAYQPWDPTDVRLQPLKEVRAC